MGRAAETRRQTRAHVRRTLPRLWRPAEKAHAQTPRSLPAMRFRGGNRQSFPDVDAAQPPRLAPSDALVSLFSSNSDRSRSARGRFAETPSD
ncbi:unnamed protein product, partial [Iphiclides podalirius]